MSPTPRPLAEEPSAQGAKWFVVLVTLAALALRLQRLDWQPLWWDEGYSLYFATEPVARMAALTAADIHPPFYYLVLHSWFALLGDSGPVTARLLSVFIGVLTLPAFAWLLRRLLPAQPTVQALALLLLAFSPWHTYYSHEVRMYGLALLLTLLATTLLWDLITAVEAGRSPRGLWLAYVLTAALALLTLYYSGLLLLAHQVWILSRRPPHWARRIRWAWSAAVAILLLQAPWWSYAFPRLVEYVAGKVVADQDAPLGLLAYLWRHALALGSGHLVPPADMAQSVRQIVTVALLILAAIGLRRIPSRPRQFLLTLILVPLSVGFLVNLRFPFFPDGGERLLLPILPYALLLPALGMPTRLRHLQFGWLLVPLTLALLGQVTFFTQPRYADHDYRALIRHVWQHARPQDTVFAIFPWQVGYWRAYSPRTADGAWLLPQPPPLSQDILTWSPDLAAQLDRALDTGAVWFPAPLSFGSTLPPAIEQHLAARAANLENRWFSPATRLSAWTALPPAATQPIPLTYNPDLQLTDAAIASTHVAADNSPLGVTLAWRGTLPRPDLRLTLRLVDANGQVWAQRDHTPLGQFARPAVAGRAVEALALTLPAGLPPQPYRLTLGVGPTDDERLFMPSGQARALTPLADLVVTLPTGPVDAARLPIQVPLTPPLTDHGLMLLGYNGPLLTAPHLAGEPLALTLFLAAQTSPLPRRDLYVALLTADGAGAGGWEGWPLPAYTTDTWPEAALTQVPVTINTAADLPAGRYQLVAGFLDAATHTKSPAARLGDLTVTRRSANFTPTPPQRPLDAPVLFGDHARLLGFTATWQGSDLTLALHWEIRQPLLPPHAVFVHLADDAGTVMAQADGEPTSAEGRAPSGSWLPGEFLTTYHALPAVPPTALLVRVGLYNPTTLIRLPATVDGAPQGDTATFALPRAIP